MVPYLNELPYHSIRLQCLLHCRNIPLIGVVCQLDLRKTSHSPEDTSTSPEDIFSGGGDPVGSSTTEKWFMDGDSASEGTGILRKSS